jgi:hypothetical protein
MEHLKSLHTWQLMYYLKRARRLNGLYRPWDGHRGYTVEQIKEVLATREHIPNKAERRKARQELAHRKKHR